MNRESPTSSPAVHGGKNIFYIVKPATVAQHVVDLLVGEVIGSNLGPTPCHN